MNFVDLPAERGRASNRGANDSGIVTREDERLNVSKGGDAADILPDEVLKTRIESSSNSEREGAPPAVVVRGKFAQLQRELEVRIERFDRTNDIHYEDEDLIIYRLHRRKDYAYIFDYCEIDDERVRRRIVESMEVIADDRTDEAPRYPLVVRKPHMFRSGERHVLFRLLPPVQSSTDARSGKQ